MSINDAGLAWLTSDAGRAALDEWSTYSDRPELLVPALRKCHSLEEAQWLAEQLTLRQRGGEKFATAAQRMLFTAVGLEQATDHWVAAYKSRRWRAGSQVVDLCCGIGGDLQALAERGPAVGVDRDPIVAALAQHNARAPTLACAVEQIDVGEYAAWHIDPDRRPAGRRTTRVVDHQPGLDVLSRLLARNPQAAIKLAPAAEWPDAWNDEAEFEWISRDGHVRQLVAWFGSLAQQRGRRVATPLDAQGNPLTTVTGTLHEPDAPRGPLAGWLYEPDAAVIAAGLVGALARQLALEQPTPGIAYLTGSQPIEHPAVTSFAVRDVLPFDLKRLKRWFREHSLTCQEVKKRGVDIDPAQVLRQLRPSSGEPRTLIVMPHGGRVIALVAERCGG